MDVVQYFRLFGGFRLVHRHGEEREEKDFRPQKSATLFALLLLRGSQTRDEICDLFWPEVQPAAARNSLSAALSALRRELGDEMILADRHRVSLDQSLFLSDVAEFDAAFKQSHWKRVVELYTGPLLPGFYSDPIPAIAREYHEKAFRAFSTCLTEFESSGEFAEVLVQARRARTVLGDDERWFLHLMRAYGHQGDPTAALQVYESWQQWGRKNNEALPEAAYQLAKSLRREKQQSKVSPVPSAASNRTIQVTSLPLQWTNFFGRETEKAELQGLLNAREKLVTIAGTGGAGKTRLAIETLRGLATSWNGPLYFVQLAPLQSADLLFDTIRDALKLPVAPDLPPLEQITQALRGSAALVCLDNFEQIVEVGALRLQELREALPEVSFLVTSRVFLNLPGEYEFSLVPLPIPRQELTVEEIMTCPSIALFCDRAMLSVDAANATAIGMLCRRLEGIPLALELAAARAKVLSPSQILERLNTSPDLLRGNELGLAPRHRTLRATIEWSINLLEPQLRAFFQRLSIFRGGWTVEAVEKVVAPGLCHEYDALDYLDQLRSHSLISMQEEASGPRFRMLEMLREWGEAQLTLEEKAELHTRHFHFLLDLVEEANDPVTLARRGEELAAENANFRLALDHALHRDDAGAANDAARLVGALCNLWEIRTQHTEGADWAERALQKAGESPNDVEARWKARLYCCCGIMNFYRGDYRRAKSLLETGLAIYRQEGDLTGQAWALTYSGRTSFVLGQGEETRRHGELALEIARKTGDVPRLIGSLMTAAWGSHISGSPLDALDYFNQCLELCYSVGERRFAAICEGTKAFALLSAGRLEESRVQCERVFATVTPDLGIYPYAFGLGTAAIALLELGDVERVRHVLPITVNAFYTCSTRWEVACMLTLSANTSVKLGEWERAALIYGACEALCESVDFVLIACMAELNPPYLQQLEAALSPETKAMLWNKGHNLSLEAAVDLASFTTDPSPTLVALNV